MLVRFTSLLVSALLLAALAAPARGGQGASEEHVDGVTVSRIADRIGQEVTAPGAAWVVSTPDHTATGATGAGIGADTDFAWGSVSKAVAGLVTAELVCDERLDLDRPALTLLPGTDDPADDRWSGVTVGMLLDHTSGVPELFDQLDDETPHRSPASAVDDILDEPLVADPGAGHHYSSANYLLLQVLLESAVGRPYAAQVTDLLEARGVPDPVVSREEAQSRVTGGHRYLAGRPVADRTRFDDLGLAYGYLGGSASDLAAVGRSVLGDLADPGCTAGTVATRGRADRGEDAGYGLGWRVGGLDGDEPVLWHGGALPGHSALLAVVPEQEAVVVVLQDAYSPLLDASLMAPGLDAAAALAGGSPPGSGARWPYWAGLVLLLVLTAGLGSVAVRLARHRPRGRRRSVAWVVAGSVGIATMLLLPGLVGLGDLPTLFRWQPDLAVLAAGCGLTGVLVVVGGLRGLVRTLDP